MGDLQKSDGWTLCKTNCPWQSQYRATIVHDHVHLYTINSGTNKHFSIQLVKLLGKDAMKNKSEIDDEKQIAIEALDKKYKKQQMNYERKFQQITNREHALEAQVETLKAKKNEIVKRKNEQINTLKSENVNSKQQIVTINAEKISLNNALKKMKRKCQTSQDEMERQKEQIETLETENKSMQKYKQLDAEKEKQIESLDTMLKETKAKCSLLQAENEQQKKHIALIEAARISSDEPLKQKQAANNPSVKGFRDEVNALFNVIESQIGFIQLQNPNVLKMINASDNHADLLMAAKNESTDNEQKLLKSILNLSAMDDFLKNIIRIENMFNSEFNDKQRALQREARSKYAPQIPKYEKMRKPECKVESFVDLLLYAKNDLSAFKKWIVAIGDACKEAKIKIIENSGAKEKNIERAFYKSYYVYAAKFGDDGFQKMTDVLRASLVFDAWADLYRCFALIEEMAEAHGGILRCKDRYNPKQMPFGYRDLLINVHCPKASSPLICEIQLHHQIFYKHKKISHKLYKIARIFDIDGKNFAYDHANAHVRQVVGTQVYKVEGKEDDEINPVALLEEWKLDRYENALIEEEGYDDVSIWHEIELDELKKMGFKTGHAKKFINKVKNM